MMYSKDTERLVFNEHPRPWWVYNKPLRPQLSSAKIIEIKDANGKAVVPWPGFDDGHKSHTARLRLARFIVNVVNDSGEF
jgi:hypothetical protein